MNFNTKLIYSFYISQSGRECVRANFRRGKYLFKYITATALHIAIFFNILLKLLSSPINIDF